MPDEPTASVPDDVDPTALIEQVERDLLGPREYTRLEVAERVGLDPDEVRSMWRALGFATVSDDDRLFTDADVEALRDVRLLREVGQIDGEVMHSMTRIIGQTFARLASWQGQVVVDLIAANPQLLTGGAQGVTELIDKVTPLTDALHSYTWRRQLAAYFARIASTSVADLGSEPPMVVGFADMANFTSFTRASDEATLRDVLAEFETVATDVVGAHRGQIVKTIGDEVLFVAGDPHDGVEIALSLVEAADTHDVLPALRAGVAFGSVVSRLGDVFGQPVNIASRLTSLARTGSVLADNDLAHEIEADGAFTFRSLRPVSVRGYQHLRPWRVRRATS